jgi:hypothetical protein
MNICLVGAKLFLADGGTDMAKLAVTSAVLRIRLKIDTRKNVLTAWDTC